MQSFRNLKVWGKAHELTLHVYAVSQVFPPAERYGLTSQIRRAAASIGCNIAEGCCRKGDVEMGRFLQIALGSASEVEYQALLARDLRFLESAEYECLETEIVEVKKMLTVLVQKLRTEG